jgi:hypothetical protein
MFENPVAKRTAIAAAIGAVIAIPVPFVGPLIGAVVGGGIRVSDSQEVRLGEAWEALPPPFG